MTWVERALEACIWKSRILVFVAVVGGLATSIGVFFVTSVDTVLIIAHVGQYATLNLPDSKRDPLHNAIIKHVVGVVDGYLLATVLLIFSFGLYELFISKLDSARTSQRSGVLIIRSLDDLKNQVAKVIVIILVVTLFERIVETHIASPSDVLLFAASIAMVGLGLWLTRLHGGGLPPEPDGRADAPTTT